MNELFLLAVSIGCIGYAWIEVLTKEGHFAYGIRHWYETRTHHPEWVQIIAKPILGCSACCSAHIAFWTFMLLKFDLSVHLNNMVLIPFIFVAFVTAKKLDT